MSKKSPNPQTRLNEYEYKLTKEKIEDLISDDFDSSSRSDGEYDDEFDNNADE